MKICNDILKHMEGVQRYADLFRDSPDVCEAFPKDDKHLLCPTAEGRCGTVKSSVPCPQHNHCAS